MVEINRLRIQSEIKKYMPLYFFILIFSFDKKQIEVKIINIVMDIEIKACLGSS